MEKVRKDLDDMVKSIGLKVVKNRYGNRSVCRVRLFNDEIIDFADKSNELFDLLNAYRKCGKDAEKVIVSKKLVEEVSSNGVDADFADETKGTYICVVYELENGKKYRLFASRYSDIDVINLYYDLFKEKQKNKKIGG